MPTFSEILSKPSVFSDRNVLSPHYVPGTLPDVEEILTVVEGLG